MRSSSKIVDKKEYYAQANYKSLNVRGKMDPAIVINPILLWWTHIRERDRINNLNREAFLILFTFDFPEELYLYFIHSDYDIM